jgi:hypothetical protein
MLECPLCKKAVNSFHRRSHLIPEWMHKDCYDVNHKLINVDLNNKFAIKKQKGDYDEIICTNCEIISQEYDRYASLILTNRSTDSPEYNAVKRSVLKKTDKGNVANYWENIDFLNFQKFVFACMLRTHFHMKKKGKYLLIDKHFWRINKIYQNNLIDDKSYPILVLKYSNKDSFRNIMVMPFRNKIDGHHFIEFSGAGYMFRIFVSSHNKPQYVNNLCLKKDGSMYLIEKKIENTGSFKSVLPDLVQMSRD